MRKLFLIGAASKQRKACEIAANALDLGASMIKPGVKYEKVAEAVEESITTSGAGVAFPTNIAVNDIAAHFTPNSNDEIAFEKGDVVKIDVGAHIGGFIGDTARTVEVGGTKKHQKLIRTSKHALDEAIASIKPGVDLGDVGGVIEEVITGAGLKPIRNLAGHSIEKNCLHGALTIPNTKERTLGIVRKGDILAIEPFVTDGKKGRVKEGKKGGIYSFTTKKNYDSKEARIIQHTVLAKNHWKFLPFCRRMLIREGLKPHTVDKGLKVLVRAGGLYQYRILSEKSGGIVAQTEHTVLVTKTGCDVLTLGEG
jgi:methionyl aminopeptidase